MLDLVDVDFLFEFFFVALLSVQTAVAAFVFVVAIGRGLSASVVAFVVVLHSVPASSFAHLVEAYLVFLLHLVVQLIAH